MKFSRIHFSLILIALLAASTLTAQELTPDVYKSLNYRYIGPVGNRVIAVAGVPGDPNTAYFGAASGGLFKTTDAGIHWTPVFDKQDVSSVGSIAIAPSDPNVIWAGTGESFIRSNISIGNGIYKSTDAGETWTHMGLGKTGRIGRVVIDPRDPNVVFAAALGHSYGPQPERGVYKTTDGGETWKQVLFVDEKTGASDLAIDPNNPRNMIAGMWSIDIKTWVRTSGGPGSGLYRSTDSGETWKKLSGSALPKGEVGKTAVAYAPSMPNRIFAIIETAQYDFSGVLWRSDDGGANWKLISRDQIYTQRPHYYTRLVVSPDDEDEVYFQAHGILKSTDGGITFSSVQGVGGDDHDMWIDPTDSDRQIVGNDGGVALSTTHGRTWHRPPLPIGQLYHVEVDNEIPYNVYGNRQDGPSTMGPSNNLSGRGIPIGMWHSIGGFESGFAKVDKTNQIVYSGNYDGVLERYDRRTGHVRTITVWPNEPMGWGPAPLKYRWNWTFPIEISPHDDNVVYVGSQHVHKTTNGGQSWEEISPDLTTNDKTRQLTSGGLTIDNIGVDFGCTLFAISESPVVQGLLWVGSNDGLVHVSQDGGKNWTNVSKNIKDLPEWGTISNIEPSRFDATTAYITVDFHQVNNRDPYVYKTNNYGKSWKLISKSIPKSVLSYAQCVAEDPYRQGMLYLGTENAVYFTIDDGENWLPLQNNLPPAPARWLVVQEHFSDLVIGTYGRGFYIMDDIGPLRQLDDDMLKSEAHLFDLRAAYRYAGTVAPMAARTDADGQNPAYGAYVNYYLKDKSDEKISITIHDSNGKEIRKLNGKNSKGINRVVWDLQHERAVEPKVRTLPLGFPHDNNAPKRLLYNKDGWRRLMTWGFGGFSGPKAIPGEYTVKLHVGDKVFEKPLVVRKDPNTTQTVSDISEQVDLAIEIRENISRVATLINKLEWIRKQVDDLEMIAKTTDSKDIREAADVFDKKAIAIEEKLFQLTLTGTSADDLRGPTMMYSKLMNLANQVKDDDFKPTDQHRAVHKMHTETVDGYVASFKSFVAADLKAFNTLLMSKNLTQITVPAVN